MARSKVLLAVLALFVAAAAIYWIYPRPAKVEKIRVGYVPVTTALPLFVAQQEGLFERAGVKVEVTRFETANLAVESLVSNRIDATSVVADLPWLTIAQRDPSLFKLFAWSVLDAEIPMDMILTGPKSRVRSLEDLRGKTLATFPGSQLKSFARAMLNERGIDAGSVNIVELPPQNHIPALISGSADAIFCLQPVCTIAQVKIGARTVESSPIGRILGGGRPIAAASFGLSTRFVRENPELAQKFVKAMWRAMDLINKDPLKYRSLYPSFAPVPAELASRIPVTKFMTSQNFDRTVVDREIAALTAAKLLSSPIPVDLLIYRPAP